MTHATNNPPSADQSPARVVSGGGFGKRRTKQAERMKNLRGLVRFWKTEAKQWRKLFEDQRGGDAFSAMQRELCEAREKLRTLQPNNSSQRTRPAMPENHNPPAPTSDARPGSL